jgi:hypothetical protein
MDRSPLVAQGMYFLGKCIGFKNKIFLFYFGLEKQKDDKLQKTQSCDRMRTRSNIEPELIEILSSEEDGFSDSRTGIETKKKE